MKVTLGLILCLMLIGCGDQAVELEFRLAQVEPADTLTEMTMKVTGQVFYVGSDVALANSDVDSATVSQSRGRPSVYLFLNEAGTEKFARLTGQNVGRQVAILIDGELVSAPAIRAQIDVGRAIIDGNFTAEEATRVAAGLSPVRQ